MRREGSRCEKTEAAIKKPIAAPAWTLSGTRPPLRNLCVLPAVRAAGGGFRRRRGVRGALCAGSCTLGRVFGLGDGARPRTWRYAITHCMGRQGSRATPAAKSAPSGALTRAQRAKRTGFLMARIDCSNAQMNTNQRSLFLFSVPNAQDSTGGSLVCFFVLSACACNSQVPVTWYSHPPSVLLPRRYSNTKHR